ncbi:MAG: carbohydrate kinase family protein [bacterium]
MLPIILTGSISIDRIMNFAGRYQDLIQPDKIHVLSLSVLIDNLTDSRGGTAGNIAYNLGLLGDHPVLLGSVGPNTQSYIADLQQLGIDTSYVHKSHLPTATFTVLTDQSNNQIGGFYSGAMSDSDSLSIDPWLTQNPIIVISANDPKLMRRFTDICKQHNLRMIYDLGQQVSNVSKEDLLAGISAAQILILNDYELGVLSVKTGISESNIKNKVPIVITTLGEKGSIIEGKDIKEPILIKAVSGIIPLDPTGAGDAYRAGFLHGFVRNMELKICCQLGSCLAAYTVEKAGTQTHHFTMEEFSQRYLDSYKENYASHN